MVKVIDENVIIGATIHHFTKEEIFHALQCPLSRKDPRELNKGLKSSRISEEIDNFYSIQEHRMFHRPVAQ